MSQKPVTAEEAIEAYQRLRAKNEGKPIIPAEQDPIWVERSVKAPGSAQYCMHELKFTTAIPADEKTPQKLRDLRKVWDAECEEFEKQHVRPENGKKPEPIYMPGVQAPPSEGWDALPWRDNPYGQGIFSNEPKAAPLLGMIQSQANGKLDLGGWIYSINKNFINRTRKQ